MLRFDLTSLTFVILFLTGACAPTSGESTGSTTESGTDATGATTDATTDEPSNPTGGQVTGEDTTTTAGDSDTTSATEGEDTDGETTETPNPVTPEQEAACEAGCQKEAMCIGEPDASECVLGCIEEFQYIEEECASPYLNFVQCIAELSCADLEGDIEDTACGDELAALESCSGPACVIMMEETTEDSCGFGRSCPELPTQSISCEGDTCRCFLDETEVAQCAADGVCMDGDAIFDKMASCCQFE